MGTGDDEVDRGEEVQRAAGLGEAAEERALGRRRDPGRIVVGEPADVVEQPEQEELRGQGGDGEIEALDAQAGQPEHDSDEGGDHTRDEEAQDGRNFRNSEHEVVAGVGADRHETAGAERDLSGVAGEQVQAERGQPEHEELGQDRPHQVLRAGERGNDEREDQQRNHEPVVLADGEDRLVAGVGGLELACFAVKHFFPLVPGSSTRVCVPPRDVGSTSSGTRVR